MSSLCTERSGITFLVYSLLFLQDGCHWLEGGTEVDVLTIAYAALNATAVIGASAYFAILRIEYIVLLAAA